MGKKAKSDKALTPLESIIHLGNLLKQARSKPIGDVSFKLQINTQMSNIQKFDPTILLSHQQNLIQVCLQLLSHPNLIIDFITPNYSYISFMSELCRKLNNVDFFLEYQPVRIGQEPPRFRNIIFLILDRQLDNVLSAIKSHNPALLINIFYDSKLHRFRHLSYRQQEIPLMQILLTGGVNPSTLGDPLGSRSTPKAIFAAKERMLGTIRDCFNDQSHTDFFQSLISSRLKLPPTPHLAKNELLDDPLSWSCGIPCDLMCRAFEILLPFTTCFHHPYLLSVAAQNANISIITQLFKAKHFIPTAEQINHAIYRGLTPHSVLVNNPNQWALMILLLEHPRTKLNSLLTITKTLPTRTETLPTRSETLPILLIILDACSQKEKELADSRKYLSHIETWVFSHLNAEHLISVYEFNTNLLHYMAMKSNIDQKIFSLLLTKAKEILKDDDFKRLLYQKDDFGFTPLSYATHSGNVSKVLRLINLPKHASLDINHMDANGHLKAQAIACAKKEESNLANVSLNFEKIEKILALNDLPLLLPDAQFRKACIERNGLWMIKLLKSDPKLANIPLDFSFLHSHPPTRYYPLYYLIIATTDSKKSKDELLRLASILLEKGVDLTLRSGENNAPALHDALNLDYREVAIAIAQNNPLLLLMVNNIGATPLHLAISKNCSLPTFKTLFNLLNPAQKREVLTISCKMRTYDYNILAIAVNNIYTNNHTPNTLAIIEFLIKNSALSIHVSILNTTSYPLFFCALSSNHADKLIPMFIPCLDETMLLTTDVRYQIYSALSDLAVNNARGVSLVRDMLTLLVQQFVKYNIEMPAEERKILNQFLKKTITTTELPTVEEIFKVTPRTTAVSTLPVKHTSPVDFTILGGTLAESAHHYLRREQLSTHSDMHRASAPPVTSLIAQAKPSPITWTLGPYDLTSDTITLKEIRNSTGAHWYLWIAKATLALQGLSAKELRQFRSEKFDEQHIRRLQGSEIQRNILLPDGTRKGMCFTHELKNSDEKRIFCAVIKGECGKNILVACLYGDALHTKAKVQTLLTQTRDIAFSGDDLTAAACTASVVDGAAGGPSAACSPPAVEVFLGAASGGGLSPRR